MRRQPQQQQQEILLHLHHRKKSIHYITPIHHRRCRILLRYQEVTALRLRFRRYYRAHHSQPTPLQVTIQWPVWTLLAPLSHRLTEWVMVYHVLHHNVDGAMPFITPSSSTATSDCHGCLLHHSMYTHVVIRLRRSVSWRRGMICE